MSFQERLLPGIYHVAIGGTSPNTPAHLLTGGPGLNGDMGAPTTPVRLQFEVLPA